MKKLLFGGLVALLSHLPAHAQGTDADTAKRLSELLQGETRSADETEAYQLGQAIAQQLSPILKNPVTDLEDPALDGIREMRNHGKAQLRPNAGIADEKMAKSREAVLDMLGIDESMGRAYVFISFSMPEPLIQSYVKEALWSGAILVLRGIDPDYTLSTFVTQKMRSLIDSQGASAAIQIDPTLFDRFNIQAVPAIVVDEQAFYETCSEIHMARFTTEDGQASEYQRCAPVSSEAYYKTTGAVSLHWALEQFADSGSVAAQNRLEALRKGGFEATREQSLFDGDYAEEGIPVPEAYWGHLQELYGKVEDTPFGRGFTPPQADFSTE